MKNSAYVEGVRLCPKTEIGFCPSNHCWTRLSIRYPSLNHFTTIDNPVSLSLSAGHLVVIIEWRWWWWSSWGGSVPVSQSLHRHWQSCIYLSICRSFGRCYRVAMIMIMMMMVIMTSHNRYDQRGCAYLYVCIYIYIYWRIERSCKVRLWNLFFFKFLNFKYKKVAFCQWLSVYVWYDSICN